MRPIFAFCVLSLGLGCGGGGNDAEPMLIPGGGIGSGEIDGVLHVYVIDEATDMPLTGASVRVGEPAAADALTGTTDSTGLATFQDVSGKQTITVTAAGHVTGTWIGANGANVTVPLPPTSTPAPAPSAHVEGTIAGWDTLDDPAPDHLLVAIILYSFVDEFEDPANQIAQPTNANGDPLNICARSALFDVCSWELATRTGKQAHYAIIVDIDTKGTEVESDDTTTLVGYAIKTGIDLTAGQSVTGEQLTLLTGTALTNLTVSFDAATGGLTEMNALSVLDLGDEGNAYLFAPELTPEAPSKMVPALAGDLANARYDIIANARTTAGEEVPGSSAIVRGVDIGNSVAIGPWLATPGNPTATAGTYSFTPSPGASLHVAGFADSAGKEVWGVGILDGSTSFTLPALTPDPLPAGEVELRIEALEITGFDAGDFQIEGISSSIRRAASNRVTFNH